MAALISVDLLWMWLVERQGSDRWDLIGGAVALGGMAISALGPRRRVIGVRNCSSGAVRLRQKIALEFSKIA